MDDYVKYGYVNYKVKDCIPTSIVKHKELSVCARVMYLYLWCLTDDDNTCHPTQDQISRELGITKPTINKALKELEACGLLRKELLYKGECKRHLKYTLKEWQDETI